MRDNIFCWHGISTDVEGGQRFYPAVLGWDVTMEPGGPVFASAGGALAHLQPAQGPPSWCAFLSVPDVDASTARAEASGGRVVVGPTDLPVGRYSVVTTPSGAVFGLYQAAKEDVLAADGPGSVHWVELHSTDVQRDLAWLGEVFGFTTS
ncbi:MAG: VOC family protein, partial [Myxococcales bacterium]|nr:VOC family protein [Myxococcales bacterium]